MINAKHPFLIICLGIHFEHKQGLTDLGRLHLQVVLDYHLFPDKVRLTI